MRAVLLCAGLIALPNWGKADETIDFNRQVRPILADRCFPCHGPDEHDRQADLRLDVADESDGAYRAIVPGSVEESEVWYRLVTDDEYERMPPIDSSQQQLTEAERDVIRRWIEQGAKYEAFWAFVAPAMPILPTVDREQWNQNPIDRLVYRDLTEHGLEPNERADRRTLIRRLSLDLTGLPPSREELQAFLNDASPNAYEQLVDRLLAKPQFGEHATKFWLDLVRFADTNGIHHDHYRELTPYRDWIIRAYNNNLPYDQFLRDQLAGDLLPEATRDQLIASGFHRLHLIIDRGTALPEESFHRNVVDRVTAVGTAFLGLTVQCAVCHDHKYDPITAQDFYQLYAFFNNIDAEPKRVVAVGRTSDADFSNLTFTYRTTISKPRSTNSDTQFENLRTPQVHSLNRSNGRKTKRGEPSLNNKSARINNNLSRSKPNSSP